MIQISLTLIQTSLALEYGCILFPLNFLFDFMDAFHIWMETQGSKLEILIIFLNDNKDFFLD